MTYFCTHCKLTSEDGNRWCEELDCPAGQLPRLLPEGEQISTFTIIKTVRVLPATTIYIVEWNQKRFYMKVANPDPLYEDQLKQEAEALRRITDSSGSQRKPGLPVWVRHPEENSEAFGITSFRDETKYYFLMEYVEGTLLYEYLLDNPQPWHKHVGWFLQTLARALIVQHDVTRQANLNLTPENILVVKNTANVPQPMLLDLGLLLSFVNENGDARKLLRSDERKWERLAVPAYSPPILMRGGTLDSKADLFSIGLIAYEMLAGRPTYPHQRRSDTAVRKDIASEFVPALVRNDLPRRLGRATNGTAQGDIIEMRRIVRRALSSDSTGDYRQYETLHEFLSDIRGLYGPVKEKKPMVRWLRRIGYGLLITVIGGAVLVLIWSLLAALLNL